MTATARKTAKKLGPVAQADFFERKYTELLAALKDRIAASREQIAATKQRADDAKASGHETLYQLCHDEAIGMLVVVQRFEGMLKVRGEST